MSTSGTAPHVEVTGRLSRLRRRAAADSPGAAQEAWRWLDELSALAGSDRQAAEQELNELFRQGTPPKSIEGPTEGILVATLVQPVVDKLVKAITSVWMPWQGKSFDREQSEGVNRLSGLTRWPAKLLWPLYATKQGPDGRLAFDFETRLEPGVHDPGTDVLVIDYAPVESNPDLVIRSIRDELVEVVPGAYLGKIMYRMGGKYTNIGFFALRDVGSTDATDTAPEGAEEGDGIEKAVLGAVEKGFGFINRTLFRQVNKATEWWNLPLPAALMNLRALRDDLREYNLYDTNPPSRRDTPATDLPKYRTYDGADQDPYDPEMGKVGTRFGRNAPVDAQAPEPLPQRMEPSPREVARRLMHRDTFKPATTLNVLAACWIQFQNHDWFGHGENAPDTYIDIPLDDNDDWPEGSPMRMKATHPDRTRTWQSGLPPTYINTVTHWWDLSQVYGSTEERNRALRSGTDGKLLVADGMLPNETDAELDGVDLTGFADNYWVGLSLLHTLFVKEHNAICDMLKGHNPTWDDERLFLTARLVNSALSAKIHTVEWTPGILANPVLERAMNANWYGILPRWIRERFGHVGTEMIGGITGSDQEHHTAPYAITEEFVSVYRLHPLLPDDYQIRDHATGKLLAELEFDGMQGHGTRPTIAEHGWSDLLYSFGVANPGAIVLNNHPKALTSHVRLNGDRVDLATIDIARDRERGVPRYNDFREKLRKKRITKWSDISDDPALVEEIKDVYGGDLDRVDLQVGMLAETPPPGFGFSDTAFRIFILMASRRLRSDRFFTDDYTPEVYTPEGLEWVESSSMSDVLLRHHPELAPALEGVPNAFAPWNRLGER